MRTSSVLNSTNKVLFFIVLILGWGVYNSLFSSPPKSLNLLKQNSIQDLTLEESSPRREIASVRSGSSSIVNFRDSSMDVLNIDCRFAQDQINAKKALFKVNAPKVRLKLTGCGKEKGILEVSNKTNGYSASLFTLEDMSISTDFMDMNDGDNAIEVKKVLNGSHSSFILTIFKEPNSGINK